MLHQTNLLRAVAGWVVVSFIAGAGVAAAGVAKRTASFMALEVPAEHAKLGQVYHVKYPGESAQVNFTSNAILERIVGTTNAVVGYVVAETEGGNLTGRILAGGFRLPVRSFDSGIPMRNGHMMGRFFFNAKEFPEITVAITGSEGAKLISKDDESATYAVTLIGDLTIRDVTKTGRIPANLTFMKGSEDTKPAGEGDVLALRCQYEVKRSEFNVAPKFMPRDLADKMVMDQFMILTTVSTHEALVERSTNPEASAKVQKFGVLFRDLDEKDAAYAIAEQFVRDYAGASASLTEFAREISSVDGVNDHGLALTMQAAMRAVELTHAKDADVLQTVAFLHFGREDLEKAVEWQRKAVAHKESSKDAETLERMMKHYEATLARSK